jgi:hypothetical protein
MCRITIEKLCKTLSIVFLLSTAGSTYYASAEVISREDGGISPKGIPTFQVAQQKSELPKRPPASVKPEGESSLAPQEGEPDTQIGVQIKVPQPPVTEPVPDLDVAGEKFGS